MRFTHAGGLAALVIPALAGFGCAKSRCEFNSDCQSGLCVNGSCVLECQADIDCSGDTPSCVQGVCRAREGDAAVDGADTSIGPDDSSIGDDSATPIDTGNASDTSVVDTGTPTDTGTSPIDTGTPLTDTGPTAAGYLASCSAAADCISGLCTPNAPRFCTKACAASSDCALGQICAGGACRLDDTGVKGCNTSTGAPCLVSCIGTPTASHCTHTCANADDCPAGFACSPVSGSTKVCVAIEHGCSVATDCESGIGFCGSGGVGCTAKCNAASDCPNRLNADGLPPYTCQVTSGVQVCVPPADVLGSDPMGSSCPATGTNSCRSGACDTSEAPPTCVQRCTVRGGCGPSFGCFADQSGSSVDLVCANAGAGWLGSACTRARDCYTSLCQSPGYCTKFCNDGYCPPGMSCVNAGVSASDGTPIMLCSE